jgi:hypothetical protein
LAGAAEKGAVEAVSPFTTPVDATAAATAAVRQKTKVAVVERRAGVRAITLAMRRGSKV